MNVALDKLVMKNRRIQFDNAHRRKAAGEFAAWLERDLERKQV
jgi:hypothetical protein